MVTTVPVVGLDQNKGSDVRFLSFSRTTWLTESVKNYFKFEAYDQNKHYPSNTLFYILAGVYKDVRDQFYDRRAIIDVCLEAKMPVWDEIYKIKQPHHTVLYGSFSAESLTDAIFVPNFFLYNESLQNIARGYQHYQPQRNFSKKFLMPIGRKTKWRDKVVERLESYLDDAHWSYVRRGRALPNEPLETAGAKRWDTRFQNPSWYNDTCFTLVLESMTQWNDAVVFVTEKTYKPISHQHPFMIIGAPKFLYYLKSQGFETFDNLFNESYDEISDFDYKIKIIINNIEIFQKQSYDKITLQKLEHNAARFYDRQWIQQDIEKSFVEPVMKLLDA